MKTIIYCRKSQESEDRQIMSLDSQEAELLKLAEKNNIEVVTILRESMSAKAPGRPLFAEMLSLLSKGKADTILCWKLDRLARNPIDGGSISWMLQNSQIKSITTHDREYLPSDNVLLMSVEFGMSNQYVRDLSENVKRGNREKLRRGEWPNHAPLGYINDKNTKTLKIHPENGTKVQKVFSMYATGNYSYGEIAKELQIAKSNVERILKKTFYYGLMERNGEYYPGKHKPLITKELFDDVKAVRENTIRPRAKTLFFPYRGLMTCAQCGCQLTASRKKGLYDYYYCTNGKGVCTQHKTYIDNKTTSAFFEESLKLLKFDSELIEIMYQASLEKHAHSTQDNKKALADAEHKLEQLTRQERKLLQTFTSEIIDEELYKAEATRIREEKENLEQKKEKYTQSKEQQLATLELTKNIFLEGNKAMSEYKNANPERKRKIAQSVLWNLQVKDKNVLNYRFKSPFNLLAKAPKKATFTTLLPD